MAAPQAIRGSSSGRTVFKNIVRVFPALVIIAATINTVSCKNNNGLLEQTGGSIPMPFLVEVGVLLDLFTGVFVMGIIIHHISREFASMSTEHLTELKD